MSEERYRGVVVPMVTPFRADGSVDETATENLVKHISVNNCHPFVLGTTGEALSISQESKRILLSGARKAIAGNKTLYAGISGTCLEETVENAKEFMDLGADVLVAHLPSYYQLSPGSMLRYFGELADQVTGPLMIYNIVATTHMSIPVDTVLELSEHPSISGLKDSERDVERMDRILDEVRDRNDFVYQLGWAAKSTYALKNGADGIVPSTGNAFPNLYHKLYQAIQDKRFEDADKFQRITDEISQIYQKGKLLSEALPGLKVILEEMGICKSHGIAPCYELEPLEKREISSKVQKYLIQ